MSEATLKVWVDPAKCQGHNRCYNLAPEIFDVDDLGNARAVGAGLVGPELSEKARRAAANCPEYAIVVEELRR